MTDTAALPWQTPRQAPQTPFVPAGHIALDLRPAENPPLGFPSVGPVWIAGLYVSWALQSAGLGRAAMAAAEALAGRPPLNGRLVLLDTMPADEQMQPAFVDKVYVQQGNPVPAVSTTSLDVPFFDSDHLGVQEALADQGLVWSRWPARRGTSPLGTRRFGARKGPTSG